MADAIFVIDIGPDGIVAVHPRRTELPVLVAPVPEEDKTKKLNTIRPPLVAIGCMMIPGKPGFEFDSSVVSPLAENRLRKFAELMLALKNQDNQDPKRFAPCAVFGHADPTGKEEYNKTLSGRRALAVYGLLTRNTKIWDVLFNNPHGNDKWGLKSIQLMLSIPLRDANGPPDAPPSPPFYTGPIDGLKTPETTDAISRYQEAREIAKPPTGFPGEKTRERLFLEYMNAICHDNTGAPFQLEPTDFIARNKDKKKQFKGLPGLNGDVMGCGEFNPVLLLSQDDEDRFKPEEMHEARNEAYAEDRRVLVYIFKHGTEIEPEPWPCPRALEPGEPGCTRRFWSDGRQVRLARKKDEPRRFKETRDTMACRFYHGFAFNSPCEAGVRLWIVRFRVDGFNNKLEPLKFRRYVLQAGSTEFAPVIRGTLDADGEIRIPVFDEKVQMTLKLDVWGKLFPPDDTAQAANGAQAAANGNGGTGSNGQRSDPSTPTTGDGVDPASGTDTDRFADEDKFMTLVLDAGALASMDKDTSDLPVKQRLYNLGFGSRAPAEWTQDEFDRAVAQYRKSRNLKPNEDTRLNVEVDHDLSGAPPPVEDD